MKPRHSLDIAAAAPATADASPEHKRFRSLLQRIEKARLQLQAWQTALPEFAQQHAEHIAPLERRWRAERQAWAFELEQLLLRERWSRQDQDTLARMIVELTRALMDSRSDEPEAELKALHDRHADIAFDEDEAQSLQALRASIEAATGADLGDGDFDNVEELMAHAREQLQQRAAQDAEAAAAPAQRRRKGQAAQRRAEADAAVATQSLREVYRKLAGALHPDRIDPAATPAQRAERTEQMARANAAYAAGDLLALLTLQLQVEQIDLAAAGRLAAAQVRHFNRVLAEQLKEIEHDIAEREHTFCSTYGYMPERRLDPARLAPFLKEDAEELLALQAQLREQRKLLLGEPRGAKRLLKQMAAEFRLIDRFGA
jgi:hypothetical protein